jgi:8-oxo-dGTP pyrophosphatase MutT (NUDIX family)
MTPLSKLPDFDPRRVPVVGVDAHLPAVATDQLQAGALQRRFANPPHWHPELVIEHKFADRLPAHASVLVPLVMHDRPTVLLTERTAHLSTHSGQVAFPGGRVDEGDADAAATALREAHEEVGLEERFIEVIGTLPTYTTGTAFIVTPVVALVRPGFVLQRNPDEVADIFEVPLDFLMNPANHRRHAFEAQGVHREWFSMPYTEPGTQGPERFIWGATAGMLRNFYCFLAA